VDLWVHPNWFRFRDAISRDRCLYFSANAERDYRDAPYAGNSVLVFGSETDGLPQKILDKHPERCFRIPMPGEIRSLNLANAVSVVLYEGLRQLGVKDLPPPELEEGDSSAEPGPPAAPTRKGRGGSGRGRGRGRSRR
jgi:tRNA (cytidine/uridine-2'-O-)-methyltransferase